MTRAVSVLVYLIIGLIASQTSAGEYGFQGTEYDRNTAVYYLSSKTEVNIPDTVMNIFNLSIWKDNKTNELTYRIGITAFYKGDWRYYSGARRRGGDSLNFIEVNRDVVTCAGDGSCTVMEDFIIVLSKVEFLGGITFQVNGRGYHFVFEVPKDIAANVQRMADQKF